MPDKKTFTIGWIGTNYFRKIEAKNAKEAKKLFAELEGVKVSYYIVSRRRK